nr:alpha/beta hydrolase [Tsukamurella sp. PLM1]
MESPGRGVGGEGLPRRGPGPARLLPGVRPDAPAEYGMSELVSDAIAIADALGWERFDLVGHDWGGAVAWWTAAEHPGRLRSLTVVSTPHPAALGHAMRTDEDQANRSRYMLEWRNAPATENAMLADGARELRRLFGRDVPAGAVDEYVQRLREPGALTAALNWYRAGRPPTAIGPVETPTLYVWTTDDVAFGDVAAFATKDHCTGPYRFEMLEDVSHWAPEHAPEAITTLLLEQLDAT